MKKLLVGLLVVGLTGCATGPTKKVMTPDVYLLFANIWADNVGCYQKNYISPQQYAEGIDSFSHVLNTWVYDVDRMKEEIDIRFRFLITNASNCKNHEFALTQVKSASDKAKGREQRYVENYNKSLESFANSMNPPRVKTTCLTTGSLTMCN
ncbi:hypothetical protein [Brumicola nitratireducens]|uniref:Lipoprotein n=1 Tax=Glaciecola nitratireducens (strain JCM 12485 / KCTC 12276 / FR1064) TaxID=1085623 RepID=G4QGW9_GLANF|nr:hypothetical protein [Glaciecola nitratireducens]AEP29914.1 hypothetical protein GNIT_1804 [Glaciecola nitratireducens FR1064]